MSAPPRLIHIKRKRGDEEAPVNYLQLDHGTKRHRSGSNWVYQRRIANAKSSLPLFVPDAAPKTASGVPIIRTSQPGDEFAVPKKRQDDSSKDQPSVVDTPSDVVSRNDNSEKTLEASRTDTTTKPSRRAADFEPRRFHMSRASMTPDTNQTVKSGISKKQRYGTAVFVERSKRKSSKRLIDSKHLAASVDTHGSGQATGLKKPSARRLGSRQPSSTDLAADANKPDEEKKPEIDAQRKPLPSFDPAENAEQRANEMDHWVLHELGLNLQQMQIEQQPSSPRPKASPSRFKPKAPAQRFADRNPDLARQLDGEATKQSSGNTSDAEMSDEDYEIEVYELTAQSGGGDASLKNIPPEQIGVLQFDTQDDLELFYGNEDSDSDDLLDDEEDENAENHYTADYPEDEVDSDDEFDRNPYLYHHGMSDDDDEYADTNPTFYPRSRGDSDDEDEDQEGGGAYVTDTDKVERNDLFDEHIRQYIRKHGSG